MNQLPSPDSGADTTQDVHLVPKPRGNTPDAVTPQTTAGTDPDCAANPGDLRRYNDERLRDLETAEPETYRRIATKLGEFLRTNTQSEHPPRTQ